jgi:hypothetical protein
MSNKVVSFEDYLKTLSNKQISLLYEEMIKLSRMWRQYIYFAVY